MIHPSFDSGRIQWTNNKEVHINRTIRLWPHKLRGKVIYSYNEKRP